MKKKLALMAASAMITGALTQAALASTPQQQVVTANIAFAETLSLTLVSDIDFGIVQANRVGDYTITTAGVVSTPAFPGPNNGIIVDDTTANAGEITITGAGNIDVDIASYSAAIGGVVASAATCKYGVAAEVDCEDASLDNAAAPGAGTALLLGVTVHADGTQNDLDTAAPTFTVEVVFS